MLRLLSLFILFLTPISSFSQSSIPFAHFNSHEYWDSFPLSSDATPLQFQSSDTVMIVASNRVMDTSTFRYLVDRRDKNSIKYFVVYTRHGKRMVRPVYSLKEAVAMLPDRNRDWVVYTEGMGKFFTSATDRGIKMAAQYGVNVILLDYPSISSKKKRLGNYFFAKRNAAMAHKDFAPVLDSIRLLRTAKLMGNGHLSLFFHSMGNIALRETIRKGKLEKFNQEQWVDNLILNAACIPQRGHKKLLDRINFSENILVHYNPGDFTLGGAYLVSKRYQLGKQVRKPLSAKATYINFNTLVNEGHSYFLNFSNRNPLPEAATQYYSEILHGKKPNLTDSSRFQPTTYRNIGYDILP